MNVSFQKTKKAYVAFLFAFFISMIIIFLDELHI